MPKTPTAKLLFRELTLRKTDGVGISIALKMKAKKSVLTVLCQEISKVVFSAINPPLVALYTDTRNDIFNKGKTEQYCEMFPFQLCIYYPKDECYDTKTFLVLIHAI